MNLEWIVGYNMPGYMPESEPNGYDEWKDAREALLDELAYSITIADQSDEDTTDLEECVKRVRALTEGMPFGETVGAYHYWLDRNTD
jgi:hypothetical protein